MYKTTIEELIEKIVLKECQSNVVTKSELVKIIYRVLTEIDLTDLD